MAWYDILTGSSSTEVKTETVNPLIVVAGLVIVALVIYLMFKK